MIPAFCASSSFWLATLLLGPEDGGDWTICRLVPSANFWGGGVGCAPLRREGGTSDEGKVAGRALPSSVDRIRWEAIANPSLVSRPSSFKSDKHLDLVISISLDAYSNHNDAPNPSDDLHGKVGLHHNRNRNINFNVTMVRRVNFLKMAIVLSLLRGGDIPLRVDRTRPDLDGISGSLAREGKIKATRSSGGLC